MVDEYLSDREQEEALFKWWRENWIWVIAGVGLGLAGLGGWQFWKRSEAQRAEAAAQVYADLTTALTGTPPDTAKGETLLKDLDQKYSSTPYADQGHLLMAQAKVNAGQYDQAATELRIVVDKSDDADLVQIAKIRLARVQLQLGRADDALALLDADKAGAFAGQVHDVRGDALLAKGDRTGAKLAYEEAMKEFTGRDPQFGEFTRLKLQDLADVATPAAAAPAESTPAPPAQAVPTQSEPTPAKSAE